MQLKNDVNIDSMSEPLVSICCMTYNHENYIRQCLDGFVMQQTTFPIEILVHDDASTDNTSIMVKEYEAKYPHLFRCVYQTENQFAKQNAFVNIILPMSRGKYIALCDGDDYWTDPYKLQKQVDLLEAHPECSMAVAKTDVYQLKDGEFHYQLTFEGLNKDLLYFEDIYKGCYFHTSTYVIPKINIIPLVKYRGLVTGDTAIRFILIDIGPFVFLREIVSVYRVTGEGIWSSLNSYETAVAYIKLFEGLYTHFKPRYKKYWGKRLVKYYKSVIIADITGRRLGNVIQNIVRLTYLRLRYAPLYILKQSFRSSLRAMQIRLNRIAF